MPKKNANKPSNKPKPKKNTGRAKKSPAVSYNTSSLTSSFASALRDPFAPDSYGVRVPDPFSFPTATHHIHGEVILGNSVSSGAVVFLPNPIFSLIDLSSCVASFPTSMQKFFTSLSSPNGTTQGYGSTIPSQLGAIYGEYRVASWGLKISNLMPELSATGRIIIVPLVVGDTTPTYSDLTQHNLSTSFMCLNTVGVDSGALSSSSVMNFNDAIVLTTQDFLHGDIEIGCSVVNGSYYQFKTAQPIGSDGPVGAKYGYGDSVNFNIQPNSVTTATTGTTVSALTSTTTVGNVYGTVYNGGFKDPTRMNGGVAWVVYFEGIPDSTSQAFVIEYIYHLEGTPNNSNGTSKITPQPSIHNEPCVGTTSVVEAAIGVNTPMKVLTWITKGAQFLDKASTHATGKGILAHAKNAVAMHPIGNAVMKMFSR